MKPPINRRGFLGLTAGGMASMLSKSNPSFACTPLAASQESGVNSEAPPAEKLPAASEQISRWIQNTPYPLSVPESADKIQSWRKQALPRFRTMLGLDEYRCELPRFHKQKQFTRENLTVHQIIVEASYPSGSWEAFLIEPQNTGKARPAFVCLHGFTPGGMSTVVGLLDGNETARSVLEERRCDYGLELARQGCVTLSFHCPGFGSRSDAGLNDIPSEQLFINALGIQIPYLGWCVADAMTAVSLLRQWPTVDKQRIGTIGFSMGATIAAWTAALDDRVSAIVWSGRVASFRDRFLKTGKINTLECIPGLCSRMDKASTIALAAPKPMFLSQEVRDDLPLAKELVNPVSRAYQFLNAEDKLTVHYDQRGIHQFIGEPAYDWIKTLWPI